MKTVWLSHFLCLSPCQYAEPALAAANSGGEGDTDAKEGSRHGSAFYAR
jgi:hypothetical protein